jgi:hypothetical protein
MLKYGPNYNLDQLPFGRAECHDALILPRFFREEIQGVAELTSVQLSEGE